MSRNIPTYELYGDFLAGRTPDALHLEKIRERSSLHDWTIRLHKHRHMAQVFAFRSAGVQFRLGDMEHTTTQPTILVVPPGTVHGFRFSDDVVGDVLSLRLTNLPSRLQSHFKTFQLETASIFRKDEIAHFDDLIILFEQLTRAYHVIDQQRDHIMYAIADLILLYLVSDLRKNASPYSASTTDRRGRRDLQSEAFCMALEENFRNSLSVADYATLLGISASHLTRICREVLGAPPNALVQQRRMLEAKRLLEYTKLSIAEISDRSGFKDPAFFSRTFKSQSGMTPKTYRDAIETV